jgi:hypothetical protein
MPDWWSDKFGESHKGFSDYSGSWKISKDGKNFWDIQLKALSGTRSANPIGQSAPYRLEFIIGDADENESMIFVRQ